MNGDGHVDATEVYCMVLVIYGRINRFALVTLSCPSKRQIDNLVETFDLDDSGASGVYVYSSGPAAHRVTHVVLYRGALVTQSLPAALPDNLDLLEFKLLMTLLCKNIVTRCVAQLIFVFLLVPIGATVIVHSVSKQYSESVAWMYVKTLVLALTPEQV